MLNIGIVGCGNWSFTIIKELEENDYFNLDSIFCRNYISKNIKFKKKIIVYDNIDKFFSRNTLDCIYVAGNPILNLQVVNLAKKDRIPLILEKPISNSYSSAKKIQLLADKNNLIIVPNLTNYFSDSFFYLKNYIEEHYNEIKKIIIYEGNNGPFRKNIHPIWDWGFHSFSTLLKIFENKKLSEIHKKEIKNNNSYPNAIVAKFMFSVDSKFEIKLVTGNLFKKKIRKIKIILKNNNILESNMINHKIFLNKNIVFENNSKPLQKLLNTFYKTIKEKNTDFSKNLVNISCETTRILESFYNC